MKEGDIPNDEPKKHASIVKNVVATTFALILMAIFAFVAVLTKPLDPVKRAMDMRDKEDRKPEEEKDKKVPKKGVSFAQHIMVTLLAVAIMGFFDL